MPDNKYSDFSVFKAHFPTVISDEIQEYANNQVLDWSCYLFTRRVKGMQFGFCTHCKKEYMTENLKHKDSVNCKKCGWLCQVKANGLGRSTLIDEAYLLYYMKSEINPDAIIAQGYYLKRDYTGDYRATETEFKVIAMYLFEPGHSKMFRRPYWPEGDNAFHECKTVFTEVSMSMNYKACYHATHSIRIAVEGTPFQYCTWERYDNLDYIGIFDLAANYQCIEFLTKIGLQNVVEAKLGAGQTYGVINWRGKTPEKVLRLSKREIKDMRTSGVIITAGVLNCYHRSRRQGLNYTFFEANGMEDLEEGYYSGEIRRMTELASAFQIKKYLAKQYGKEEVRKHYGTGSTLFVAWRDYTRECKELGMDLKQYHILFPNNIYRSHQKTMKKIKIKADEALNGLIAARLPALEAFWFEKMGLMLRPAASKEELFAEGAALEHCVGSHYTKDYARGDTDIFLIRLSAAPDKPYYTMEVKNGKVLQCEGGKGSRAKTKLVEEFVNAFVAEKLSTKVKTRKTKSNKPQGVAV